MDCIVHGVTKSRIKLSDFHSQVALWIKNLPAVKETQVRWVRFMGQEDPLERGMATHSSILAWEISWTEEAGRLQTMGLQRDSHTEVTEHIHTPVYLQKPQGNTRVNRWLT